MKLFTRTVLLPAVLAVAGFGAAQAQECPSAPAFTEVSTSDSDVRASARSLRRGEYDVAIHFASEALGSGAASRHKNAAQINLCAAYAQDGQRRLAAEACDEAVRVNGDSWEALTNRGANAWLSGDAERARADFAAAAELGGNNGAVAANSRLASCAG
jgi:tetratricopeptide (TPR) repeat protein